MEPRATECLGSPAIINVAIGCDLQTLALVSVHIICIYIYYIYIHIYTCSYVSILYLHTCIYVYYVHVHIYISIHTDCMLTVSRCVDCHDLVVKQ